MTRAHRTWHLRIWLVLLPLLALGLLMAIVNRPVSVIQRSPIVPHESQR
jgi:hypothetical protein